MGKTTIEWTDASWNPIVGCTEISPGCANCYAARLAGTRLKNHPDYHGLVDKRRGEHRWLGEVRFLADRLEQPRHWKKPRRIFVCDMGDLFHESVADEWLLQIFQAMARAPRHTYQILTKRVGRMKEWIQRFDYLDITHPMRASCAESRWPWPNVWLGVSVENQHFADERIPLLLETPAAVRWISAEPLLGPVDLDSEEEKGLHALGCGDRNCRRHGAACDGINWVVCGGESGANARPMDSDWARSLRDQCQSAGVPFFFKQWGQWIPLDQINHDQHCDPVVRNAECTRTNDGGGTTCFKVGKKKAGRLLDGREWNEFPREAAKNG